jgi:hypothetical protein
MASDTEVNAESGNEDMKSTLFELFCKERLAGMPVDRPMTKVITNHLMTHLKTKIFQKSEG